MEKGKLKELLGIAETDTSRDNILQFAIDNVQEIILNYCHITVVPEGLLNTAYRMAIDLIRNENPGKENIPLGAVSSITVGDTSTSFKSTSEDFTKGIIKNYQKQLNRYRKVGFI